MLTSFVRFTLGIVIVVFFKCMAALLNPVYRRGEPIKWGLVSYTALMFSLVAVGTMMQLDVQFTSYIDNREFPGNDEVSRPGPIGYQLVIYSGAISVIQNVTFTLTNWLADGFLVRGLFDVVHSFRCLTLAPPALPLLRYLLQESLGHRLPLPHVPRLVWYVSEFSIKPVAILRANVVNGAMGIAFVYQSAQLASSTWPDLSYFSLSLSLNILLTLMIVIRLITYTRNTRAALGVTGTGGLCKAIVTILVESCALYAANSLLVIGLLGAGNLVADFFLFTIPVTQVRAFLRLRSPDKSLKLG